MADKELTTQPEGGVPAPGEIDPYAAINIRAQRIIEAGMEFNEKIWFLKGQKGKKFWKEIEASPVKLAARQRSFAMMLRFIPQKVEVNGKILHKAVAPNADQLEKMELSSDAIKRLAFGDQVPEEAQIVDGKSGQG